MENFLVVPKEVAIGFVAVADAVADAPSAQSLVW